MTDHGERDVDAMLAERQRLAEDFAAMDGSKADRLGWVRAAEAIKQVRAALSPAPAASGGGEQVNTMARMDGMDIMMEQIIAERRAGEAETLVAEIVDQWDTEEESPRSVARRIVARLAASSGAPAASGEPSNETLYRLHMVCLNAEASMREGAERLRQQLAEIFPNAGAAATSFPLLSAAALDSPTTCRVPPPGWYCTRQRAFEPRLDHGRKVLEHAEELSRRYLELETELYEVRRGLLFIMPELFRYQGVLGSAIEKVTSLQRADKVAAWHQARWPESSVAPPPEGAQP